MLQVVETESDQPICPHCEEPLVKILARKLQTTFGVRFIYFCSSCKKSLGISQRKGFWMG